MEKVGVVILNYLNYKDTIECIESLKIDSYMNKEIIIVDNCSSNESYSVLSELYQNNKNIHIIKTKSNLGFAKGNNEGIIYAKNILNCNHILLLNSDTVIRCNNFIQSFINSYEKGIGLIGCRIITLDKGEQNPHRLNISKEDIKAKLYELKNDRESIKNKLYNIPMYKFARKIKKSLSRRIRKNESKEVINSICSLDLVLHGACIMLTKDYFEYYPCLFPKTFLYCEENILTIITRKVGLKKKFINNTFIEHKEGKSSEESFKNKSSIMKKYYLESYNNCLDLFDMDYKEIYNKYFTSRGD